MSFRLPILATIALLAAAPSAGAVTYTFDFTGMTGASNPFTTTSNGVTASFTTRRAAMEPSTLPVPASSTLGPGWAITARSMAIR